MTPAQLIAAARVSKKDVARWHCHPQECLQNSGDGIIRHQREVATLALSLCAHIGYAIYESSLIDYCQRHDEPERLFGDWPASICALPKVKAFKAHLEQLFWTGHPNPLPELAPKEHAIFSICDKLEAVKWATQCGADLGADGFPDDLAKLRRRAYGLDVALERDNKDKAGRVQTWLEGQLTRTEIPA